MIRITVHSRHCLQKNQFAAEKDTLSNTASISQQPFPCWIIISSQRKIPGPTNPMPQQIVVVHLVMACKLPARSGKLLQARVCQSQPSSLSRLFEPNGHLYSNQTVNNFAEAPTLLRRGQILRGTWLDAKCRSCRH